MDVITSAAVFSILHIYPHFVSFRLSGLLCLSLSGVLQEGHY